MTVLGKEDIEHSIGFNDLDVISQKSPSIEPPSMDVHHIKPVRSFEDFEQAHTMENMVQVCRGCHRTIEKYDVEKQKEILS